jgi:hypothetical protein
MAKRRIKQEGVPNIFEGENARNIEEDYPTDVSHEDLFGTLVGMDNLRLSMNRQNVKVQYLPIDKIYPDRSQPRRVIPRTVRSDIRVTAETLPMLFKRWLDIVNDQREVPLTLHAYLTADSTERDEAVVEALTDREENPDDIPLDIPPLEVALMKVIELAASIRQQSLLNPITVAPALNGKGYVIETGERRWLAFYLLNWYFGDNDTNAQGAVSWREIPARVVDRLDVWHQAAENNVRDDLNAIGKSRQLALLLMDIHGADKFDPLDSFDHEQQFYAQVANGQDYRIPRGMGERLANALNLKSAKQIRDYRRLLRVEPWLWDKADEEDLQEGVIRRTAFAKNTPHGPMPDYDPMLGPNVPGGTLPNHNPDWVSSGNALSSWDHDEAWARGGGSDKPEDLPVPLLVQKLYDRYDDPAKWHRMTTEERRATYHHLQELLRKLRKMGVD